MKSIRIRLVCILLLRTVKLFSQDGLDSLLIGPAGVTQIDTVRNDSTGQVQHLLFKRNDTLVRRVTFTKSESAHEVVDYNDSGYMVRYYSWYDNRQIYQNYKFVNGWRYSGNVWYENGKINVETVPVNDSVKSVTYHPGGEIREIRYEKNGRALSATTYCENGTLVSEVSWGRQYIYIGYDCEGNKLVSGVKNASNFFCGSYTMWDEKGRVRIIGQFTDSLYSNYQISGAEGGLGQKLGIWKYFNENGKLIREEVYVEGRVQGSVNFDR